MPVVSPSSRGGPVRTVRRLAADRAGGVAILFGLSLVPLAMAVGMALDYARATDARTRLLAAADAAALSAVTLDAMKLSNGQAQSLAKKMFKEQASVTPFADSAKVTVDVSQSGNRRTASVNFTADVPTGILRLAGLSTVTIGGAAVASGTPPVYMDFHILLDNSPSMGLGATTADINTMVANTPDKCAFACHDLSAGTNDYYSLAKKLGVTMRIDVVRSATQQLMDTATLTAMVPGQFRASLATLGAACGSLGVGQVSLLTSNLSAVKTSATAVDLMTIPFQNFNNDQCTDFNSAFTAMNALIPAPGDGATSANPQKVLFFVSDGVADALNPLGCTKPTTSGRCQEPINQAVCTALKGRGIKIAALYTTYLPVTSNAWYNTWIAPFQTGIGTAMEACASPGLYFEVSPSQGISEAMTALFQRAVAQARLSQ